MVEESRGEGSWFKSTRLDTGNAAKSQGMRKQVMVERTFQVEEFRDAKQRGSVRGRLMPPEVCSCLLTRVSVSSVKA
jgi:hypothetical protein